MGRFNETIFASVPGFATELSAAAGRFVLDLSEFGPSAVVYEKIPVFLANYTCVGTNFTVFDNLRFRREVDTRLGRHPRQLRHLPD